MRPDEDLFEFAGNCITSPSAYPETPGFKSHDTSKEAAEAIKQTAATLRARVLHKLWECPEGLTADECAEHINADILAVRPRLSELKGMGCIGDSGVRRRNASGLKARVMRYVKPINRE